MSSVSVVNWNVEWRLPMSSAAGVLSARIFEQNPDVVCLTEAYTQMLPEGFVIEAEDDWGYPIREGRRKVLLWSKEPWSDVDLVGHPDLPSGRFVRGQTDTPAGRLNVIGVCIPWAGAHVTSGRRDRKKWDDHLAYLAGLERVLSDAPNRLIVLGDFNQKVPRSTAPLRVFEALEEAVLNRLPLATEGQVEPMGVSLIDHVAHSRDLSVCSVATLSNDLDDGPRLTDHVGVAVVLSR